MTVANARLEGLTDDLKMSKSYEFSPHGGEGRSLTHNHSGKPVPDISDAVLHRLRPVRSQLPHLIHHQSPPLRAALSFPVVPLCSGTKH